MAEIKDDNELDILEKEIKDFRTTFSANCYGQSVDQMLGLRHQLLESISKLTEKWSTRLKEGDLMMDRFQEYTNVLHQKNKSIEEKQEKLSEVLASIRDGEKQNADLMDSVQELKEKLIKTEETKSKATEEKMERLRKVEKTFRERTGLEIRKTCANHLQFIFRCIDHKDPEKPFMFTLSINEEGAYEVISCSPPLDCIEELQLKIRGDIPDAGIWISSLSSPARWFLYLTVRITAKLSTLRLSSLICFLKPLKRINRNFSKNLSAKLGRDPVKETAYLE